MFRGIVSSESFFFWLKFWVISILPLWVLLQWSPCNRGSVLHNGTSSAFYNTAAPLFHSTSETEYSHIHNTCRDKRETGEYGVTEPEQKTKKKEKIQIRRQSNMSLIMDGRCGTWNPHKEYHISRSVRQQIIAFCLAPFYERSIRFHSYSTHFFSYVG